MNKKIFLYVAFAVALIGSLGSFVLSEIVGWVPCELCWYQRIFLYPLVIVLGAAIIKDVSNLRYIALPMIAIGWAIAFFHGLLQYGFLPDSAAPCLSGVSCTTPYHLFFEFITIPLMSLATFTILLILVIIYTRKENHE